MIQRRAQERERQALLDLTTKQVPGIDQGILLDDENEQNLLDSRGDIEGSGVEEIEHMHEVKKILFCFFITKINVILDFRLD